MTTEQSTGATTEQSTAATTDHCAVPRASVTGASVLLAVDSPAVSPVVTHASLVAAHLLRLQATDPASVVLDDARGTTPEMDAAQARGARLDRWFGRTLGSATLTGMRAIPCGSGNSWVAS